MNEVKSWILKKVKLSFKLMLDFGKKKMVFELVGFLELSGRASMAFKFVVMAS